MHLYRPSVFRLGCIPEQFVGHVESVWIQFVYNWSGRLVMVGERGEIQFARGG